MKKFKTIKENFSSDEYDELVKVKGSSSWHDFILNRCLNKKERTTAKQKDPFEVDIGESDIW